METNFNRVELDLPKLDNIFPDTTQLVVEHELQKQEWVNFMEGDAWKLKTQ